MAKYQYKKVRSPEGVLVWPHLNTPDDKFVKPDGVYHTKLVIENGPELDDYLDTLRQELERYIEANPREVKSPKFGKKLKEFGEPEIDDEGNETGRFVLNFKLKPRYGRENEYTQAPKFFDEHGNRISESPNVGNGTRAKLHGEMFPYFAATDGVTGISLRVSNVQILELVEFTSKEDNPFDDESGDDAPFADDDGSEDF
jgi:hypothetical protein